MLLLVGVFVSLVVCAFDLQIVPAIVFVVDFAVDIGVVFLRICAVIVVDVAAVAPLFFLCFYWCYYCSLFLLLALVLLLLVIWPLPLLLLFVLAFVFLLVLVLRCFRLLACLFGFVVVLVVGVASLVMLL